MMARASYFAAELEQIQLSFNGRTGHAKKLQCTARRDYLKEKKEMRFIFEHLRVLCVYLKHQIERVILPCSPRTYCSLHEIHARM